MDPTDKELEARFASGDVNGIPLKVEGHYEAGVEGVVAVGKDGRKVFLPKPFVDLIRYRNRGKD